MIEGLHVGATALSVDASLPMHVGIIPDGNRRYAQRAGLSKDVSYLAGAGKALEVVSWCREAGIRHVSAFGVSQENIARRPDDELHGLHAAVLAFCHGLTDLSGVTLHIFGDPAGLPASVPGRAELLRLQWREPDPAAALTVHVGVNYSGRAELAAVARAAAAHGGDVPERHLLSAGVPAVDLVMRTGGQRRLSGFLPLQTAYAELWFTDALWSELTREAFHGALAWYAGQERRLGE